MYRHRHIQINYRPCALSSLPSFFIIVISSSFIIPLHLQLVSSMMILSKPTMASSSSSSSKPMIQNTRPQQQFPQTQISTFKTQDKPQTQNPKTTTPTTILTTSPSSSSSSFTNKITSKPMIQKSTRPQHHQSKLALIFNTFDTIINNYIDPPIKPSVNPKIVLSQNFAPVDELPPTECEIVHGSLPSCLDGAYIRNGPNPQFFPSDRPYHFLDGDGMLHAIRISQGKATFCSRFVKTYKYNVEKEAGYPLFPNVFASFNGFLASASRWSLFMARVLMGQYKIAKGIGVANTSLALIGNRLLALGESDLPYEVKLTEDGDIVTQNRHDFNGKLFVNMTAHPKIDTETNEAFAFRYGLIPPFLNYFWFNSNGEKQPDVPIWSFIKPPFLHDFAITKKYAVFVDMQMGVILNPIDLLTRGSPIGSNPSKVSRIGVVPRYATDNSETKWFDVPGFNNLHAINAWDEEDAIVLIAPNILSIEHTMERTELIYGMVEKLRIDLKTGIVTRQPISTRNLDFGMINQAYVGKKNRFVYAAIGDSPPRLSGVVKLDLKISEERRDCIVGCRVYGEGCYGGEPFFVAREPENPNAEEDDGYVVTYVHDQKKRESRFLVMDAKSPELEVVAVVRLPRRVPHGFHGLFVRESEISKLI